jgi:hypothetical protein
LSKRFVYRRHLAIVRQATSAYHRNRRAQQRLNAARAGVAKP